MRMLKVSMVLVAAGLFSTVPVLHNRTPVKSNPDAGRQQPDDDWTGQWGCEAPNSNP